MAAPVERSLLTATTASAGRMAYEDDRHAVDRMACAIPRRARRLPYRGALGSCASAPPALPSLSGMNVDTRLITQDDVPTLVDLLRRNREALAEWEPTRTDDYFTAETQHRLVAEALTRYGAGVVVPLVITADGELAGRINIDDVVRGVFQSAHLGYWVDHALQRRGVATAAVADAAHHAFDRLGLHRLQADTLVHNAASQTVLARNGFTEIGRAPRYLRIAGSWQDCVLHQLLNEPAAPNP